MYLKIPFADIRLWGWKKILPPLYSFSASKPFLNVNIISGWSSTMRIRLVRGITFLFVGVPVALVRSADKEYYLPSVFAWKEMHI